jgi:hypothetical protein
MALQRIFRGRGGFRASSPEVMRPRFALGSSWPSLDRARLRIVMHRLLELEEACYPGPARSRFRSKRLAAVAVYRAVHGRFSDSVLSVSARAAKRRNWRGHHGAAPQRLYGHRLFATRAL